ncbi:uncharacterized protein C8Q71DRAFT_854209 [Rhodofomes roseus]|uniref:F-box domain-containing protein n=1 Tax=Rhodofomes roseus TaxID=34475 RepID=A0ABQ8KSV5_9APHY|nr:uncharacterized protein C8Q71DRAFT_854209 [Rhodofomes roseus]KAH9841854.1 hypothetical protein C8Q71DRAFT_854209 [Rhodofomes roseus]
MDASEDVREVIPDDPTSDQSPSRQAICDEIAYHIRRLSDLRAHLNTFVPVSTLPPEVLSDLRASLNTFVPIFRLPPEVLSTVFLLVARSYDGDGPPGTILSDPRCNPYEWVTVTHVCSHWRAVALGCPALWSHLIITSRWYGSIKPVDLFLERSQTASLDVTVLDYMITVPGLGLCTSITTAFAEKQEKQNAALCHVLAQMPRIRRLWLNTREYLPMDSLKWLDGPAPRLQSQTMRFKINFLPSIYRECIERLIHHPETGNLRHLELHKFQLDWRGVSLPSLTHLTLGASDNAMSAFLEPGNTGDLLVALARMPNLQELVTESALSCCWVSSAPTQSVKLPHLRHLRMTEHMSYCVALLEPLDTPSLETLTVIPFMISLQPAQGLQLRFLVAVAAKMHSLGVLRSLAIESESSATSVPSSAHIRGYIESIDSAIVDQPETYLMKHHTPILDVRLSLECIGAFMEIPQLTPIWLDIHSLFLIGIPLPLQLEQTWRAISQHTTDITELYIRIWSSSVYDGVLPWMLLQQDVAGHTDRAPILNYAYPCLRLLTIDNLRFRDSEGTSGEGPSCVDRLVDSFVERYEAGAEIERVRILQPRDMVMKDLDRLKEVVREVECNEDLPILEPVDPGARKRGRGRGRGRGGRRGRGQSTVR